MIKIRITDLKTPAMIIDIDALERNIQRVNDLARRNDKELWPMIKTHKSTDIMKLQMKAGATGVLCGTIDECEAANDIGINNIMYAYPVADNNSIVRILELAKNPGFIIRIDNIENVKLINREAQSKNIFVNFTVIINSGLNRFGIEKDSIVEFLDKCKPYINMKFKGISTHPGQVYSESSGDGVKNISKIEIDVMKEAKEKILNAGYECELVSSGSTPTFYDVVSDQNINVFHPGNYVFNDAIQMSLGIADECDCALTVLSTITTQPRDGLFMCDAGAKCLGLDKGAHGNSAIIGHGLIVNHPDAIIDSLSEEVGKIKVTNNSEFKIGEKIRIIPNHSCSVANLTNFIYGHRGGEIVNIYEIDIRGNSKKQF